MAYDEPQRQLVLLIRELSAEKTKDERRLLDQKNLLLELQADYESASSELEQAKRLRETAERELRGSQAQLDRTNASLLALEKRNLGLGNEISKVSSELRAIKNNGAMQRDEFLSAMHEFNYKIREFNEMSTQALKMGHPPTPSATGKRLETQSENVQKDLENEISSVFAECQKMASDVNMAHLEMNKLREKVSVCEAIVLQSERLKGVSGQISELEKICSSLREELRRKYICPKCQMNNMEASEWANSEAEQTATN